MSQPHTMSKATMHQDRPLPSEGNSEDSLFVRAMEEYLCGLEAGEQPDRRELLARYPAHADRLGEFLDGLDFVHEVAPQLCESPLDRSATGSQPAALGDFRVIREIGRGGMGVVYEAEQLSLGRRVALKVLPYAAVLDRKHLARFKNEAQAAAQLRHPNIVGVHCVGCERGVHRYAMELVDGQSLAEVIREAREAAGSRDKSDPTRTSTPPAAPNDPTQPVAEHSTLRSTTGRDYSRGVARLGIQAARALDFAHEAGVVHRDVKPSNLLVDDQGHLWVTDFGLAMTQSDAGLTLTGDLLGTLRYMSPEQAAGDRTAIDHRTDVYSLGVTLYELLTFRTPFEGSDRQKLLHDIMEREPRPPRQIRGGVPRDLETIVLKAMAKEPADRYRTAGELADDFGRFLKDEPIRARRLSAARRLSKWSRRHKVALTIGACLLGVMFAVGAVLLWQQRARTLAALADARQNFQDAETQRERAEANFRRVHETVETTLMTMAEGLVDVPHTEQVQRALLDHALSYYLAFLSERPDDPTVRFDTARAYLRIAAVAAKLSQREPQEKASLEAVVLTTRLVQDVPDDPRYVEALARAHESLGRAAYDLGRIQQAEDERRRALAICKTLAHHPDPTGVYRRALAAMRTEVGFTLTSDKHEPSRFEEGLTQLHKGLRLREELVRKFGGFEDELAQSHRLLGHRLGIMGRTSEAEPHLNEAVVLMTRMNRAFPDLVSYAIELATAWYDLGDLQLRTGRPAKAAQSFERCAEIREEIAKDFPALYKVRERLALAYELLGESLIHSGRPAQAEDAFRKCLSVRQNLFNERVPKVVNRSGIAWCHHGLALIFQATDRPAEAEREFRKAIAIREEFIPALADPQRKAPARHLAWGYFELAILLTELGRAEEAGEFFGQALALFQKLMADDSSNSTLRKWFTFFLIDCPDERYADAERAVVISRELLEDVPNSADYSNLLAMACYRAGRFEEAIEAFEQSTELRSAEEEPLPCHEWLFLAAAHWRLGREAEARQWYDRTLGWIQATGQNENYQELRRWLPEVRAVLGVTESPTG